MTFFSKNLHYIQFSTKLLYLVFSTKVNPGQASIHKINKLPPLEPSLVTNFLCGVYVKPHLAQGSFLPKYQMLQIIFHICQIVSCDGFSGCTHAHSQTSISIVRFVDKLRVDC